jgi:hypothetical protein
MQFSQCIVILLSIRNLRYRKRVDCVIFAAVSKHEVHFLFMCDRGRFINIVVLLDVEVLAFVENHPILLIIWDRAKVQARERIRNCAVNTLDVDKFGAIFLKEKSPAVNLIRLQTEGISHQILMVCIDLDFLTP